MPTQTGLKWKQFWNEEWIKGPKCSEEIQSGSCITMCVSYQLTNSQLNL